jgi:hypothetical protein
VAPKPPDTGTVTGAPTNEGGLAGNLPAGEADAGAVAGSFVPAIGVPVADPAGATPPERVNRLATSTAVLRAIPL